MPLGLGEDALRLEAPDRGDLGEDAVEILGLAARQEDDAPAIEGGLHDMEDARRLGQMSMPRSSGYLAERLLSRYRHAATTTRASFPLHLLDERRQVSKRLAQRPGLTERRCDVG